MSNNDTVLLERIDNVVRLVLNRPQSLNSFTADMHAALASALDECEHDDSIRAVILTATGRGFCAGQDLGDRHTLPGEQAPDLGLTIQKYYNPLIRRLVAFAKPTVCAVNGVAAGAGANIALACDIVVAGASASFIQSFSKVGLVPDSGGSWQLVRAIGLPRARAMAMLAEKLSATQAQEWGMIYKCVSDDDLQDEAAKLAAKLAAQAPLALAHIKALMLQACHLPLDAQLENERRDMQKLGRSLDYREGVDAFINKRAPRFTGK
ncbi:MAG: 2-(1,2-epoxy-1,2-dihydrophenyl)acetyl-CoA isomerase PaaG [Gammaproteobacteria bacterium]|nr:2-(1,2-epoxy-1,2-dihydrophenyl)acetyl-CoA isomerase PaaG [Pseudomonadota bacterium]MCH9663638.1 2-(1,2-epoxy-1,2-dihydrophenyl)acetyl-CoA isomerase PaaG [Gammaproteobacteria bacterium]